MATSPNTPPDDLLKTVTAFYEAGKSLDALRCAESFKPLKKWRGVRACALASRIATNTGGPRLSTRLSVRAWRTDRFDPEAQFQMAFEIFTRRGPLEFWLTVRDWPEPRDPTPRQQAEFLALRAGVLAGLRDFSAAEKLLDRAEALGTKHPWVHLQRAHLLEVQDRVEEADEIAIAACALHSQPFYRPGVQARARIFQLLDRDGDAIKLLTEAGGVLQNGPVMAQLYSILAENDRWEEARQALERYVALSPLLEPPLRRWVTSQRARVAYRLGYREDAARIAGEIDDEFHKSFREKLVAPPVEPERVHLDVTFVRQHFKTCAPATLAAIGRFWRMPSDHLKLAEAMCYDGTPHWQQRAWAEGNGWLVREFRVTYENAVALVKANIPFAISTVDATSAHMRAVAGFDAVRGTLLLRDPGQPYILEFPAKEFLERYRAFGPHGIIFLPAAEAALLDGLVLEDSEQHDEMHRVRLALSKHDRAAAFEAVARLRGRFPDHPLTWEARLDVATYDANSAEQATCLDKLLELFPNTPARLLRRLGCMRDASTEERILFLRKACATPNADPALFIELARALLGDARRLPESHRALARAVRRRSMDANGITVRADLLWQDEQLALATELYRFAAHMEGFREHLYQTWFIACRRTRRTDEALAHLQDRFARHGRQSEQPALTLAWAWREMGQPARAREVFAEASRLRPNDGPLRLRAAQLLGHLGENAEANSLLQSAKGVVRENDWLRAAADIAESRFDSPAALQFSRELLQMEPLALDVHLRVTRLRARLEGNPAALAHLQEACAQFPNHIGLRRTFVEWSRHSGPAAVETAVRELLRLDPSDAWARRELATALSNLNRNEEALKEAQEAICIQPRNTSGFSVLGSIHRRLHQAAEARTALRRAVVLSVDNTYAINSLLDAAANDAERREELAFIEAELIQQVVQGDGLLAFLEVARPLLEPEKLLQSLRDAHTARPDLWHAWSALISQLGHTGKLDDALDLAQKASAKFPHLPRIWIDLAQVHQWRNESDKEIEAAARAFEMSPAWNRAVVAYTNALERAKRFEDARKVHERAIQQAPQEAALRAFYAQSLWRLKEKDAALASVEKALRILPTYEWAWGLLNKWAPTCGQPQRALEFCRTLANESPGESRVWLVLVRLLEAPHQIADRLAAIDRVLALEPGCVEAWDVKAETLAKSKKFDEAIIACEEGTAACSEDIHILGGRLAWIQAQREKTSDAISLMRRVLAENSGYIWGWIQLSQWLLQQEAFVDAAASFEQLLRLRPRDSWAPRQLGLVRLKLKDVAGAQKAFAIALQLAPTDAGASANIFNEQLNAGDLEGAEATLRLMWKNQPGGRALSAEIRLLLRQKQPERAAGILEKLCVTADVDARPMNAAVTGFEEAGQAQRALKVLKRALKKRECNFQVAALAIELSLKRRDHFGALFLFLRLKAGEAQRRAAAPLVEGLGRQKRAILFRWLLWRRREVLFHDDAAWGQVGFAFVKLNLTRRAAPWLADWRERKNVQSWMLFNLCLSLRHLGRYEEAAEIAKYSVGKWQYREGMADMRLFLGLEEAMAGDVSAATKRLQVAVPRKGVGYDNNLRAILVALVAFLQTPSEQRVSRFKSIRRELGEQIPLRKLLGSGKDVRETFRRAGNLMGAEGGGWRARLWFLWMIHWQWCFAPIGLLLVAASPAVGLLSLVIWLGIWQLKR